MVADIGTIAAATVATISRVLGLIALSIVTGWLLGYLSTKSRRFENVYITSVNIFESIPVIAFLPIVLAIFVSDIGGNLGIEIAADFLVFDAIVWNIWIGIYQAFKTIPEHLIEVSENYNFGFWDKLRKLYIPFSFPRISSDIFPSFADALFYIMVSEVFAIGVTSYRAFGIGSIIVDFTSKGDLDGVFLCLAILAIGVTAVTLWFNKLSRHAVAKYGLNTPPEIKRRIVYTKPHTRMWYLSRSPTLDLSSYAARFKKGRVNIQQQLATMAALSITKRRRTGALTEKAVKYIGLSIAGIFLIYIVYSSIQLILSVPRDQWNNYFEQTPLLLYAMGIDYARVLVVTAVSFIFAMTLGYYLATHSKVSVVSLPVIQTLAAFPAPAYFPLVFAAIAPFLMHAISFAATEIIVLGLAFLGTFYYVFFGFWMGVKAIPSEFWELMDNYNMSFFTKMRRIILPATFPYLVTGLSSTINSAWGGLQVGEYWPNIFQNQNLEVHTGMMKVIASGLANNNVGLAAWTSLLFAIVVAVYAIIFTRNLMDVARKKYVIEEGIYHA